MLNHPPERFRQDTPGCTNKVFLNSAASSLMPKIVVEKMTDYLRNEIQFEGYERAEKESQEINEFYIQAAMLIHSSPENIAFTYNAMDSYARALSSIPFKEGDYILTSTQDYLTNQITFLGIQKRFGIKISMAKNLDNGDIDLVELEDLMINLKPILVAITHVSTNSGIIQPIIEIGKVCKQYRIWYLVDACQSIGQLNINVKEIGCDFLSATGSKFLRGPRGTGLLYLSERAIKEGLEPLIMDMRGADWNGFEHYKAQMNVKRFEMWEFSHSSLIGFTQAIHYANEIGIENIEIYNAHLINRLNSHLSSSNKLRILDKDSKKASILNFNIPSLNLNYIESKLKKNKIYYSVSFKNKDWAIRLSPHYFNTIEEIDFASEVVLSI